MNHVERFRKGIVVDIAPLAIKTSRFCWTE